MFAIQSMAVAQSTNITEAFKKHFNETVQQVQQTENADEKRMILNESFTKMIVTVDRIKALTIMSEDERTLLSSFKNDLSEKQNELNGLDGFEQVEDADLDDFSDFSQDSMEQANRTITIGASTALLILLILLLVM